ncbi:hypothetical protein BVY11_08655 [Pseudomonas amygdali pv. morsprunorum]|nr:hypothetical protein BVY11_08655 [Pseudomonas amygdali pv. morsprunorum]PPS37248.1 hypothetical protein BVY12_09025 [Pseudomonas amygdali pv. morsprunorum]
MQTGLKKTVGQISVASGLLASSVTNEGTQSLLRKNDETQQAATAINKMTAALEDGERHGLAWLHSAITGRSIFYSTPSGEYSRRLFTRCLGRRLQKMTLIRISSQNGSSLFDELLLKPPLVGSDLATPFHSVPRLPNWELPNHLQRPI